jgi:hypothetical protein
MLIKPGPWDKGWLRRARIDSDGRSYSHREVDYSHDYLEAKSLLLLLLLILLLHYYYYQL